MRILITSLFLVLCGTISAQDSEERAEIKKNLVYASAGSVLFPYTVNVFYERTFLRSENASLGARFGVGKFLGFSDEGMNYNVELMIHLRFVEIGIGATQRDFIGEDIDGLAFAFNLGYRGYTKNRRFMLRGGISLPEGLYAGVGVCF